MQSTPGGMCLLIFAGVMNAGFSLPMKFVRAWVWENTWLVWSVFALLVLPVLWRSHHPVFRRHPADRR